MLVIGINGPLSWFTQLPCSISWVEPFVTFCVPRDEQLG